MAQIVNALDAIFSKAFIEGVKRYDDDGNPYYVEDLNAAIQATMNKAKILGLLKLNVNHSGQIDTGLQQLTDEELDDEWKDASK